MVFWLVLIAGLAGVFSVFTQVHLCDGRQALVDRRFAGKNSPSRLPKRPLKSCGKCF